MRTRRSPPDGTLTRTEWSCFAPSLEFNGIWIISDVNPLVIGFLGITEHFDDGAWSIFHVEIIETFGVAQASFLHGELRDRERKPANRTWCPHAVIESTMP